MVRIILIYGALAGAIIIAIITFGVTRGLDNVLSSEFAGYLVMLVALSMIFAGVKRYRDLALGGVIRFGTALGVGCGIATVASVIYVIGWEIYLWSSDYAFMAEYTKSVIEAKRASGASSAELAALAREMSAMSESYARPVYRIGMTFMEIFPVGAIISLLSALLLRNSRFLPARTAASGAMPPSGG